MHFEFKYLSPFNNMVHILLKSDETYIKEIIMLAVNIL